MTGAAPIIVEQTFELSAPRVWRAITDPQEMRRWFFEQIREFRPERGFATEFTVHDEGRAYRHAWKVTEVIPNVKITYDWNYPPRPGSSFVEWELSPAPGGTRLRLTHTGVGSFPQDDPAFSEESCRGGWEFFLKQRLPAFLEQNPT